MAALQNNKSLTLTMMQGKENADSSNSNAEYETASEMVDCLADVIHRFSDQQDPISRRDAKAFWTGSNATKHTLKDVVHCYAPVGLETQFEQLYCLLHPCLVVHENESNAAAFCLGHRGMGKGMLVERCLQAFSDEIKFNNKTAMFRVVKVHGVLIPGHDVSLVVKDMLLQLSQVAYEERADHSGDNNSDDLGVVDNELSPTTTSSNPAAFLSPRPDTDTNDNEDERARKILKTTTTTTTPRVDRSLRLRMSTFESNLQLLGETLKIARVDQIPILIILDEVDAFLGTTEGNGNSSNMGNSLLETAGGRDRQLLLYHLLDRVATQGSNVCLIGLTQHLTLRSKLEKRIKSRMEGTSKEIFLGPYPSMSVLTSVILSHVSPPKMVDANNNNKKKKHPLTTLRQQLSQILTPPAHNQEKHNSTDLNNAANQRLVWEALEREYRMGRNIRWFSRIFTVALSLYRGEWMQYQSQLSKESSSSSKPKPTPPSFEPSYLVDALASQGASINNGTSNDRNGSSTKQKRNHDKLVLMTGNANQPSTAVDPRIQALIDMSAPQVALVLAARRILARDSQWNGGETASPPPLTLGRMMQEYGRFRATNPQSNYSRHLLWIAFQELLEVNLLRPAVDHCGTGPFQYEHQRTCYSSVNEAEDVPLQLLVDINRELMEALQSNVLECSTALREWGKKTN